MPSTKAKPVVSKAAQKKAALRERLLDLLFQAGDEPMTVGTLAQHCRATISEVLTSLGSKEVKPKVVLMARDEHAPIGLVERMQSLAASDGLLRYVANKVRAKRVAKPAPLVSDAKKFVTDSGLPAAIKPAFAAVLSERIRGHNLPGDVAKLIEVPITGGEIAMRLLKAIGSQCSAKLTLYPVNQREMFKLAGVETQKDTLLKAAIRSAEFADRVIACRPSSPADGSTVSYMLRADLDALPPALVLRMIELAKQPSSGPRTELFSAEKLAAVLVKDAVSKSQLAHAIEDACNANMLAGEIAWLEIAGKPVLFCRADIKPSRPGQMGFSAKPHQSVLASTEFTKHFDEAFRRIDSRNGGQNFLKVFDLRRELPQYSVSQFDLGLRALREADRYTMDGIGSGSRLSDAERDAGIREGSSLLVYVSRK
jgi:hypothetical protein